MSVAEGRGVDKAQVPGLDSKKRDGGSPGWGGLRL